MNYLGGYDGKNYLKTNEMIYANGSKTEGPIELPEPRLYHCMVEYSGIVILMGGRYVAHYGQFGFNSWSHLLIRSIKTLSEIYNFGASVFKILTLRWHWHSEGFPVENANGY